MIAVGPARDQRVKVDGWIAWAGDGPSALGVSIQLCINKMSARDAGFYGINFLNYLVKEY
jgi:hypothetical protein